MFVPGTVAHDYEEPLVSWEDCAPLRFTWLAMTLLVGWPLYLICNATGRPYDRTANHFDPYSPIFRCAILPGCRGDSVSVLKSKIACISGGFAESIPPRLGSSRVHGLRWRRHCLQRCP